MRLSTLAFALFAGTLSLFAQPTLLSTEMAPFGTVNNMRHMQTFSVVDTTVQGPNAIWNFDGLSADLDQPQFIMQVVDPASTPNGSLFPTSNYAWKELPNNYYRYFSLTADKMERVGSYTTSAKNYVDPQEEIVYPLALGVTNDDDWDTGTSDGTYGLRCVGYGTLHLAGATYNDVLMVRVNASELGIFFYQVYFWYSSINGAILVQYIPPGIITESGLFTEGFSIGIEEQEATASLLTATPVDGQLLLHFNHATSNTRYSIIASNGALTSSSGSITAVPGEVRSVPVNDLAPGVYSLRLESSDASAPAVFRFVRD